MIHHGIRFTVKPGTPQQLEEALESLRNQGARQRSSPRRRSRVPSSEAIDRYLKPTRPAA